MKRWIIGLSAFALVAFLGFAGAQNVMEGQGALWSIRTGGVLNIETGGALKFNSVDQTAALATAPAAVAAGYKIARGVTALDGSNPTNIANGLTTTVSCVVGLKGTAAPGDNTSVVTTAFSTGQLDLYAWKNTSGTDPTLVASTGTEDVAWICIGT